MIEMHLSTKQESDALEEAKPWPLWWPAVAFCLFLGLFSFLAWRSGVFSDELIGETDEAAHYVTALLVHDYVASGFTATPIEFASNFYLHYPRVGIGHWPPVFYVILAGWMFIFGDSPNAALALVIVMTAVLAFLVYRAVCSEFGSEAAAVAAAALFLCIPSVQSYGRMVMADLPVALFSFGAVLAWIQFLQTERRRSALLFALLAALAILTKGNGYALIFVPPVSIALARRWRLLKNTDLWLAAAAVAALTIPWNLFTQDLIVPTMQQTFGTGFLIKGGLFYLTALLKAPGPVVTAFALIGIVVTSIIPIRSSGVKPFWASMFALLVGGQVFHNVVPAGFETRYLIGSFAAYIIFMVAGVDWIARRLSQYIRRTYTAVSCAALIAAAFFITTFEIPRKRAFGYDQVAEGLLREPAFAKARFLCASSADGEGLLISEIAHREKRPGHIIARATQVLAVSGWNGENYRTLAQTPQEIGERLAAIPADVIVLDRTPGIAIPHVALLAATVKGDPRWQLHSVYPHTIKPTTLANARIEVYRWIGPARPDTGRLRVVMKPSPKVVLAPAESTVGTPAR